MKDEYGRINDRAQAIRSFSKYELAVLLNSVRNYSEEYPDTILDWCKWLDKSSGDTVEKL